MIRREFYKKLTIYRYFSVLSLTNLETNALEKLTLKIIWV